MTSVQRLTELSISAAHAQGRAMATCVLQECHPWLTLVGMWDVDKVHLRDTPLSQAGLFGDTIRDFLQ